MGTTKSTGQKIKSGAEKNYEGVSRASDSSIKIVFTYRGIYCREFLKIIPDAAGLRRAAGHRDDILRAIKEGYFNYSVSFSNSPNRLKFIDSEGDKQLFSDYIVKWAEGESKRLKISTSKSYINDSKLWAEEFDGLTISEVTFPLIRNWCKNYSASDKRITNMLSVLRSALKNATDDELIDKNPIEGWSPKKKESKEIDPDSTRDIDPFNEVEMAAILGALKGQTHNLIKFAFATGLRTSELIALHWSDLGLKTGIGKDGKEYQFVTLHVQRAYTASAKKYEVTKTESSDRTLKLLPMALAALEDQRTYTEGNSPIIFHNPNTDKPWSGDGKIRRMWYDALAKTKVRPRVPYQTRHTFASMALSSGEEPMWTAKYLGHADWAMIRKSYGKWIATEDDTSGDKMNSKFHQNQSRQDTEGQKLAAKFHQNQQDN